MRSDDLGRAAGQGALARVRAQQGRFEEAEAMAREAVAYFARTDYSTDRTWVLMDLAEVLRLAGRPEEAIATIREALGLFEQREDAVSAAHTRELIDQLGASSRVAPAPRPPLSHLYVVTRRNTRTSSDFARTAPSLASPQRPSRGPRGETGWVRWGSRSRGTRSVPGVLAAFSLVVCCSPSRPASSSWTRPRVRPARGSPDVSGDRHSRRSVRSDPSTLLMGDGTGTPVATVDAGIRGSSPRTGGPAPRSGGSPTAPRRASRDTPTP